MLTPEIIGRHYRASVREFAWRWYQKGRRYPRNTFHLIYLVGIRTFVLRQTIKHRPGAAPAYCIATNDELELFRSLLSPSDIAHCAAASITLTRRNPDA